MRTLLISCLILSASTSFAQQDPISGMHWNNLTHFNPAMSGLLWGHQASITYRNQWSQLANSPESIWANYSGILLDNHGVGLNAYYNTLGNSQIINGNFNYNYQFKFDNAHKLAIGVGVGMDHVHSDNMWIPPTSEPDISLPVETNDALFNLNAGAVYKGRKFLAGVGATHLTGGALRTSNGTNYDPAPHAYLHGYWISRLTRKLSFVPALMTRTDFVVLSADILARALYESKHSYSFAIGYRTQSAILANIQWDIKRRYRIGYNFEYNLSKLGNTGSTHEVALGIYFR